MSDNTSFANFDEHKVKTDETLDRLARQNGITWQQLATFNWATAVPKEINLALHEYVGCWKKTRDGKNFMFTSQDDPGIVLIPRKSPTFKFPTGDSHTVRVRLPRPYAQVEVETVDEFGHRAGNVTLVLKSDQGLPEVEIKTDRRGYGRSKKLLSGRYRVLVKGVGPAYYRKAEEQPKGAQNDPDYGEMVEAVIDTKNHSRTVTRVVVWKNATDEERRERRALKNTYLRNGQSRVQEGRGEDTRGLTSASHWYAVDNIALAAGWTADGSRVNHKRLVAEVLQSWLEDYHPTALARGYFVLVVEPETKKLFFMNDAGAMEDTFTLTADLLGLVGAYSIFEDVDKSMFVDMSTYSTSVSRVPVDQDAPHVIEIVEIVAERERFVAKWNSHSGQVPILYYTPTASTLGTLALYGGTGRLEDYGHDDAVNQSVHQRNLAVCRNITRAYQGYLSGYIDRVKATKDENELRSLGPPRSPYEMPRPAGATLDQRRELLDVYAHHEIEPWTAIAHQLDRFANRKSQGYPFLRIKPKYKVSNEKLKKFKDNLRPELRWMVDKPPIVTEVEVEVQIDIQLVDGEFEVITKGDVLVKGSLKPETIVKSRTGKGFPVEIGFKQSLGNPEKQVVNVKISKFQIEKDSVGKTKLSLEAVPGVFADSEVNARTGEFGGGVTIKFKDLAKALREKSDEWSWLPEGRKQSLSKWADYLDGLEIQVMIGFVGTREETVLACITNTPSFFERRNLKELFNPATKWNDLTFDEHRNLTILGWSQTSWDHKHRNEFDDYPDSVGKDRNELTPEEKVAIVHLGFYAYEEYAHQFQQQRIEFADYAF